MDLAGRSQSSLSVRKWGEAAQGFSQADKMPHYFDFILSEGTHTHSYLTRQGSRQD